MYSHFNYRKKFAYERPKKADFNIQIEQIFRIELNMWIEITKRDCIQTSLAISK